MDRCLVSITYTEFPLEIQEHCKWLATLNTYIKHTHITLGQCKAAKLHQLMSLAASTAAMTRPSCALTSECVCICMCVFFWGRSACRHCIRVHACSPLHSAGHKNDFIHSFYEVSQRLTSRCSHSRLQPNVNRLNSASLNVLSTSLTLSLFFVFLIECQRTNRFRKFLSSLMKFVCFLVMYPSNLTLLLCVLYFISISILFFLVEWRDVTSSGSMLYQQ